MREESITELLDRLINYPSSSVPANDFVFSKRRNEWISWTRIPALEQKVAKWFREHDVLWNYGIGPAASFVQTLSRLLFERTKELGGYGPDDHVIRVRLTPAAAPDSTTAQQHRLALEVLMETAMTTLKTTVPDDNKKLQELKQLAEEEIYCGYGTISEYLMLQAFGRQYIISFGWDPYVCLDPNENLTPYISPVLERVREAVRRRMYLLVVENLHVPVTLDVLSLTLDKHPSLFQLNRWLISTSSKDVWEKSREALASVPSDDDDYWMDGSRTFQLSPKYYHAPPDGDLDTRDWAVLIKEALRDAASSIQTTIQQQQGRQDEEEFWLHVAHHCLYYSILYHPILQGCTVSSSTTSSANTVTADELVRCWVAEDILFSPTMNPSHTAVVDDSQREYDYRSIYEAGNIVMQALQEFSLLPIYSLSTSRRSTSTEGSIIAPSSSQQQDAITGVSKLAEGVPGVQQDELFDHEKSIQLRWVSFMNDYGRHVSWDWSQMRREEGGEIIMSSLILRGCSNISSFPFDHVLHHHLRVLDLSYTAISSLPPWFSKLLNVRLLSLRGCLNLETLSPLPPASKEETPPPLPPLANMANLQVLDMNGAPLLELTQQDGSNKSNLHYLDLSGSKFTTLPSDFFREMSCLEELILGNCSNLKELPLSLAKLSNLLILHIEGTQITSFPEDTFEVMHRLHTLKLINNLLLISLPWSLSEAKGLTELHICNCIALRLQSVWDLLPFIEDLHIQAWEDVEGIKIHGHPSLRKISLAGPQIRCLSLRGCSRLKFVHLSDDLTALEDVDLSGTSLEEVPHNLPNFPKLRTLLLVNVPYFKRFPWHKVVRFPKVFCLDHSAGHDNQFSKSFCKQEICAEKENQREETNNIAQIDLENQREETNNIAQIRLNDSRIFHSFNEDAANKLVRGGQFLQSFSVWVQRSNDRGKEPQHEQGDICTKIQRTSPYIDVHYSDAASVIPMMKLQPKSRHVEISGNARYPHGLRHLLSVTNSIFITDGDFIRCLTDLNYSLMSLQECQLQQCHQMTVVFRMNWKGSQANITLRGQTLKDLEVLSSLKILQASNLNNLRSFVDLNSHLSYSELLTLKLLKHLHLEHCPRLEKMFPYSLSLPSLETLVILFCSNLKTIFYKGLRFEVAPSPLTNIKKIYLQELPQLQHIHDDYMFRFETPKWEKLFVRGCHSFNRLPLLKMDHPMSKVEVSGECDWWDKLQLTLPEQSEYFMQVSPPEFASHKKNVVIRTYLR